MWTAVAPPVDGSAPASRAKHSATLLGGHVYLLGGRNGNLPLKDLWRYSLAEGKWEQLQPAGERPPCLQEHTAVAYRDCIYVFGGEVGFSAGTETPLWVYQVKTNTWRKVRGQKGVAVPRGRRGHTALVHRGAMLVYGGYQDLRGSSSELWAFHFDTESWHLLSGGATGSGSRGAPAGEHPPARHKHSAVLHDDAVWVYGGMTDLQERNDFWRWDTVAKTWTAVRAKPGPGALHSHAACKLPSSMLLFGGERDGHPTNELWRFHFGTETWERLAVPGLKPQPRAESVALAVSELLLQDGSSTPGGGITGTTTGATQPGTAQLGAARSLRPRGGGSVDRCSGNPRLGGGNRVSPCERKYVFRPTSVNYVDGSGARCQAANAPLGSGGAAPPTNGANGTNFLREISKLSQINLSRLSHHKCSYSVLSSSSHDDSTESLLTRQRAGTDAAEEANRVSAAQTQPNKVLVKSQSANLLSRRNGGGQAVGATHDTHDSDEDVEDEDTSPPPPLRSCLPREPVSVPNFSTLSTSTSVCSTALTPVEVTKLVFLDSEDEYENERDAARDRESTGVAIAPLPIPAMVTPIATPASDFSILHQQFQPRPATTPGGGGRRSDSYSSHLLEAGSATTPGGGPFTAPTSARGIPKSASVRFRTNHLVAELEETSDETVSTSDYASIETVNRISSASNYSMYSKLSPLEHTYDDYSSKFGRSTTKAKTPNRDGPFGFCNPNYLGPDIQTILASAGQRKSWHVTTPDGGVNGHGVGPLGDALHRQQFQTYAKLLNSPPDSVLEDATGRSTSRTFFADLESMELHSISQPATPMTPMGGHIGPAAAPPCFLPLSATAQPAPANERRKKGRASSASRAEGSVAMMTPAVGEDDQDLSCFGPEPPVPLYMFILGGKEQGQVTVFKRPVSVWRLLLAPNIF